MDGELIDRMEAQHERIGELLETVEHLLPAWAAAPAVEIRDELTARLRELSAALDEHLAEEEARVLPLAAQHITQAEWAELGERGMASLPKDRVLVLLGYILEEADAEERRRFLGHVPLPGRLAYRMIGQRKYQREVTALRGDVGAGISGRN
jgi:hypothetical protein